MSIEIQTLSTRKVSVKTFITKYASYARVFEKEIDIYYQDPSRPTCHVRVAKFPLKEWEIEKVNELSSSQLLLYVKLHQSRIVAA